MQIKVSAGLLMYRLNNKGNLEVLLGHPGGPYYITKDDGYWGIPKGGIEGEEGIIETAIREFTEETGASPKFEKLISLGNVLDEKGKTIWIWAFQGNYDTNVPPNSNMFTIEWPRGSGLIRSFPELDKLDFFSIENAQTKIEPVQMAFILRLEKYLLNCNIICEFFFYLFIKILIINFFIV